MRSSFKESRAGLARGCHESHSDGLHCWVISVSVTPTLGSGAGEDVGVRVGDTWQGAQGKVKIPALEKVLVLKEITSMGRGSREGEKTAVETTYGRKIGFVVLHLLMSSHLAVTLN